MIQYVDALALLHLALHSMLIGSLANVVWYILRLLMEKNVSRYGKGKR
jgi:hypothetical protein